VIAGDVVRAYLRSADGPERLVLAWIHESLHGRESFGADARAEYRSHRGYEEGMVSGLAHQILRLQGVGLVGEVSFPYYVEAYRALAYELDLDVARLWGALWARRPGEVRRAFPSVVASLSPLTPRQQSNLGVTADVHFDSSRAERSPNHEILRHLWKQALR
jgi:hypothetical protein